MSDIYLAATDAKAAKLWNEALYEDIPSESFFGDFMSKDKTNIVVVDEQLTVKKGTSVTIGLLERDKTGYLPSGTKVSGNETKSTTYTDTLSVEEKNFGVTTDDPLSDQRAFYNMSAADRKRIMVKAAECMDQEFFTALDLTNTTVVYPQAGVIKATSTLATATAAVTSTDLITPELLTYLSAAAETGFAGQRFRLAPLKVEGQNYYVFLTYPDALADLQNDTTFLAGQKDAMERGKTNPLFRKAKSIWRNIIIMSNDKVSIGTNATSIGYVRSHLLGASALGLVWAKKPVVEIKKPDYDNEEKALGYFSISGVKKNQFNSLDYGAFTVVTARTVISDVTIS